MGDLRMAKAKPAFGDAKAKKRPSRRSWLEERIAAFISSCGLPAPVREFRFAPPRLFRFDFCWPELGIALEAEGGIWIQGGHNRGAAYADDLDKYNLAAINGWRVFRISERQIRDGSAFDLVHRILTQEIHYTPAILAGLTEGKVGD